MNNLEKNTGSCNLFEPCFEYYISQVVSFIDTDSNNPTKGSQTAVKSGGLSDNSMLLPLHVKRQTSTEFLLQELSSLIRGSKLQYLLHTFASSHNEPTSMFGMELFTYKEYTVIYPHIFMQAHTRKLDLYA